jgi:nucleoside-diphosphate-sugar epimerase
MASVIGNSRALGQTYNVAGAEVTSILGCMRMMARAVGVEAEIVSVPMAIARSTHPPLVHWGESLLGGTMFSIDKALRELDWRPQVGLEDGYRDSYEWFAREGRDSYEFDFTRDDELLARLATPGGAGDEGPTIHLHAR